ncbi:MAG: hypothetical protein WBD20_18065 [Pirellulaceae bacterium]
MENIQYSHVADGWQQALGFASRTRQETPLHNEEGIQYCIGIPTYNTLIEKPTNMDANNIPFSATKSRSTSTGTLQWTRHGV